jgi:hypothetical protein
METDVQVDATAVIAAYRQKLAEANEEIIILGVQVKDLRLQLAAAHDGSPQVG